MSTPEIQISGLDFDAIAGRAKHALGVHTDKDLAQALGLNVKSYSARKKAGSVPLEELAIALRTRGLSIDTVLFGGLVAREPGAEEARGLDMPRLEAVLEGVESHLARREATLAPSVKARLVVLLYDYFDQRRVEDAAFDRFLTLILKG